MESAPLEAAVGGVSVDEAMTHEVSAFYTWTIIVVCK
jgi:hypothetical protein